jgi:hypothetical protein
MPKKKTPKNPGCGECAYCDDTKEFYDYPIYRCSRHKKEIRNPVRGIQYEWSLCKNVNEDLQCTSFLPKPPEQPENIEENIFQDAFAKASLAWAEANADLRQEIWTLKNRSFWARVFNKEE